MGDAVPVKLKSLQLGPFAKRAAQLEPYKPIISYWLRFHIVQKIIAAGLHSADAECTAYTTSLMEKLEQTKAEHPNEDAITDDVAASAYCEQFALTTFAKGEKDMAENKVTNNTVDTLLAASQFLDILSTWKASDAEIASKTKYAKYHALRILKAIKAHEDPNLTNPVHEKPEEDLAPPPLDPNDPEVQSINKGVPDSAQHNPYQSYVETAPNTDAQPSPTVSAPSLSPPPPNLPSAPTGYSQSAHNDVSPISQPETSRQGSVASAGGGYFPRTDPPTFTAGETIPSLPTAPSIEASAPTSGLGESTLPTDSSLPQAPQVPDPASFYQNTPASPAFSQPPAQSPAPQNPFPSPLPQNPYASPAGQNPYQSPGPQNPYASPSHPQPPQHPSAFQPNSSTQPPQNPYSVSPPQPSQPPQVTGYAPQPRGFPPAQTPLPNPYAQHNAPAPALAQGPFRDDEASIADATKHAKWAISALNFDDAATAVKELRIALRALGAN